MIRTGKAEFTVEGACSECLRLGWFPSSSDEHGENVERCDNCRVFSSDDEAQAHALKLAASALRNPRPRRGKRFEMVVEAVQLAADRARGK